MVPIFAWTHKHQRSNQSTFSLPNLFLILMESHFSLKPSYWKLFSLTTLEGFGRISSPKFARSARLS